MISSSIPFPQLINLWLWKKEVGMEREIQREEEKKSLERKSRNEKGKEGKKRKKDREPLTFQDLGSHDEEPQKREWKDNEREKEMHSGM